jgi:hypothetical protein
LNIPVIVFDCEELGKFVRIEFPRNLLDDSHGFDDREHVVKYLHTNGDKRTTQFEHTNIRIKIRN